MPDIRSMCAIGQRGQLGLNGHLPWEGNPDKEYREDVARFFEMTKGHVLIAGPKTIGAVPKEMHDQMTLRIIRSSEDDPQKQFLTDVWYACCVYWRWPKGLGRLCQIHSSLGYHPSALRW